MNIFKISLGLSMLLFASQAVSQEAADPTSNFGPIYGTSNLAKLPKSVVTLNGFDGTKLLSVSPKAILEAQNRRTQPPIQVNAFEIYLNNDALLSAVGQLAASHPNLDPTFPVLIAWNHVALDMTSIDHTTAGNKVNGLTVFEPTYAEQFGPARSSRAMAIVHLAMFEAANVIDTQYHSWKSVGAPNDVRTIVVGKLALVPTVQTASIAAAISQAAYQTLIALYPNKKNLLDVSLLKIGILVEGQEETPHSTSGPDRIALGEKIGNLVAQTILDTRKNDLSDANAHQATCKTDFNPGPPGALPPPLCWEGFFPAAAMPPAMGTLDWTDDPIGRQTLQLGVSWGNVIPFVISPHQYIGAAGITLPNGTLLKKPLSTDKSFLDSLDNDGYGPLIPDPHGSGNQIYSSYGVRNFGGFDPPVNFPLPNDTATRTITSTKRTDDQTFYGQFWGYDAVALLCAPPRLYNMLATSFYLDHLTAASMDAHLAVRSARYLALVNLALGDAGISAWDAKFAYHVARPVTFIRYSALKPSDPGWTPLGQVASNGAKVNVTPPFPSWPSGHAVFGGAVFEIMSKAVNVDKATTSSQFDFVSDEYNGRTFGADGQIRPRKSEHFISLKAAEWENAESRIWLGIHWQRDADDGIALGNAIGDAVFSQALQPLH
jgi:PAP2 superfamily